MPDMPDYTPCPMWGHGGRYRVDPATGQRTRLPDNDAPPLTTMRAEDGTPPETSLDKEPHE